MKPKIVFFDIQPLICLTCDEDYFKHFTSKEGYNICPDIITNNQALEIAADHISGCCWHCSDSIVQDRQDQLVKILRGNSK